MASRKVSIIISVVVTIFAIAILVNSVWNLQEIDQRQKILDDRMNALQIINNTMNDGTITPSQAEILLTKLQHSNANSSSILSDIQTIQAQQPSTYTLEEEKTDFRCFQRFSTMVDIDEHTWYGVTMYKELDAGMCERDYTGVQYGVPMKLDVLRADQDIEVGSDGKDNPLYTEYRLLNGTILSFGEKEMRLSS